MNSTRDDDALLEAVVSKVAVQLRKQVIDSQYLKLVLVLVAKMLKVFKNGCLEQPLDLLRGLGALLEQLARVVKQVPICLLDRSWQLAQVELFVIIKVAAYVTSDSQQRHWVHAEGLAEHVNRQVVLVLLALLGSLDVVLHLSEGVRHSVSEPDLVVLIGLELVLEAKGEVGFDALACAILLVQKLVAQLFGLSRLLVPRDAVLKVSDVDAASEPASSVPLELPSGPNAGHHSMLVETSGFGQVKDVELDLVDLFLGGQRNVLVCHLEVVPLGVPLCVPVVLQPQVVLDVVHLGRLAQVTVLESAVEDQNVLHRGYVDFGLKVSIIAIGTEFGQVFIEKLVVIGFEVVLAGLVGKVSGVELALSSLIEHNISVHRRKFLF